MQSRREFLELLGGIAGANFSKSLPTPGVSLEVLEELLVSRGQLKKTDYD